MKYIKTFEYLTQKKTIEDIEKEYKFFHLTKTDLLLDSGNNQFTFTPMYPRFPYGFETSIIEDNFTRRVSLGKSVTDCLYALPEEIDETFWFIYGTNQTDGIVSIKDKFTKCPIGYGKDFNVFDWIKSLPKNESEYLLKYLDKADVVDKMFVGIDHLPDKYKERFKFCVPDALQTDEYWSLYPITMDYLGYIKHDGMDNVYNTNYLKKVVPIIG